MTSHDAVFLRLENWLQQVGFTNGNPFATNEAEQESRILPEFFVDTGHYNLVWEGASALHTTLVFARRGSGKTAYRVMLQGQCCPTDRHSDVLAIPYTSCEPILARLSVADPRPLSAQDHVAEIIACGVGVFLDALIDDPQKAIALPVFQRSRLAWFCRQFASHELGCVEILKRIRAVIPDYDPMWFVFQEAVRTADVRRTLAEASLLDDPRIALLADTVDLTPAPLSPFLTAAQLLSEFRNMILYTGLQALCVVVDRWDETVETSDSPQMLAAILEPLMANLGLMELQGIAFKFFLPHPLRETLEGRGRVRFDRLRACEIVWNDTLLGQMLGKRLLVYSNGRIRALAQVCKSPLSPSIDENLVKWADASPRRLLRLGELLFLAHVRNPLDKVPFLITSEDWEAARGIYLRERVPLLHIDSAAPQVFFGKRRVELTSLEYKFLLSLYRSGGWCEKEDLIQKVWGVGEGVTDQAVSRLVRRIREKIEPHPSDPVYLLTEHSLGFRLEHAADPPAATS